MRLGLRGRRGGGTPASPSGPGGSQDSADLQRLQQRLDSFERVLRQGAGEAAGTSSGGVAPVPAVPGPAAPSPVPVLNALPPAASPPAGAAAESVSAPVKDIVKMLAATAKNVNEAYVQELKNYKDIPLSEWPLPVGYQQRLAPAYLAEVYRSGNTGENYAKEFRRQHGLNDCLAAQEIDSILGNFDRMLLVDNEPGFLNRVSSEYAARRAFGLQQAFRRCQKKDDWNRPKNAPASWRSKVDWEELDRLDPRASETLPTSMRAVENEMRTELERDALLLKAKSKLKEAVGVDTPDRLNP